MLQFALVLFLLQAVDPKADPQPTTPTYNISYAGEYSTKEKCLAALSKVTSGKGICVGFYTNVPAKVTK